MGQVIFSYDIDMDEWSMAGALWSTTAYYMMGNYIQKLNTKSLVENLTLDYIVKIGLHRLLFSGLNFAF